MTKLHWTGCVLVTIVLATALVFWYGHNDPALPQATPPAPRHIRTLVTTGDVMLGRFINYQAAATNNFSLPFEMTAPLLSDADVTFINLEGPLVKKCPVTRQGMIFCGDVRHAEGLQKGGVDVVNLANNHATNYGQQGLHDTLEVIQHHQMQATGLGSAAFEDVQGLRFAFLGYNDVGRQTGIAAADPENITADIQQAKQSADIVIIAFHWGQEYTHAPTARQRQLAHLAIDAGADVIIGNHPHWIQPVEYYKDKVIVYSHGNFVFDQFWSQKTQQGIVSKFTFRDTELINVEFLPVRLNEHGQPSVAQGAEKQAILRQLEEN